MLVFGSDSGVAKYNYPDPVEIRCSTLGLCHMETYCKRPISLYVKLKNAPRLKCVAVVSTVQLSIRAMITGFIAIVNINIKFSKNCYVNHYLSFLSSGVITTLSVFYAADDSSQALSYRSPDPEIPGSFQIKFSSRVLGCREKELTSPTSLKWSSYDVDVLCRIGRLLV